jgi:hypothetical protein
LSLEYVAYGPNLHVHIEVAGDSTQYFRLVRK